MQLLSQSLFSLEGSRVPLSRMEEVEGAANVRGLMSFAISESAIATLQPHVGRIGVIESRSGIVWMRMKLLHVDADRQRILGELDPGTR